MVCCGLTTLDICYEVAAPPAADEKVVARAMRLDPGGPAANAARVIRVLGGRAHLVTALGRGPLASLLRTAMAGIEIGDLAPDAHQPPVSSVILDEDGGRAVVSVNATHLASAGTPHLPGDAGALLVDGHLMNAAVSLAAAAHRAGIPVVLDGGSWKAGTERLLPLVDVAAVSADFAPPGSGDVMAWLLAAGAGVAVRTDGPHPIEVRTATDRFVVEVPAVRVVDTLGAGDVFHGVLTLALARGLDVAAAVRQAAEVASRSVAHRGVLGFQASAEA